MGWSHRIRAVLDPAVAAFHPIPKIAVFPLIMVIFSIGEVSKVILIAIATFFPMLLNGMAGVKQINPTYFQVAENYGASRLKVFTRVVIPGSLAVVLVGVRIALNLALTLTVAVELVSARRGLGAMIWMAWETLRTEELYATIAITSLLGISFNFFIQRLSELLIPWQVERKALY